MSTSGQPKDFSDLVADLLSRARVDSTQTLNDTNGKKLINSALQDMALGNGEKFPWLERSARLLTNAPYETGTVTITQGSTTLTGVGTAWNTANDFAINNVRAGGKIFLPGDDTVYEVSSVTSDTVLTLTDRYVGDDISAETHQYWEDEYSLASDFLKPIDKTRFDLRSAIEIVDRRDFRARFTRAMTPGRIMCCAIFDKAFSGNTTPVRRVRFARPPSEYQYIPYSYVTSSVGVSSAGVAVSTLSATTDEPLVPLYGRHIIVLKALEQWYRDKKNDSRSAECSAEYEKGLARLLSDVEVGAQRPQLQPRVASYNRAAKRPYRGAGRTRTHVIGTAFDELLE